MPNVEIVMWDVSLNDMDDVLHVIEDIRVDSRSSCRHHYANIYDVVPDVSPNIYNDVLVVLRDIVPDITDVCMRTSTMLCRTSLPTCTVMSYTFVETSSWTSHAFQPTFKP